MRQISPEQWQKMLANNCNKSKHRLRRNNFGITFCCICGLLSNSVNEPLATEDEKLLITQ